MDSSASKNVLPSLSVDIFTDVISMYQRDDVKASLSQWHRQIGCSLLDLWLFLQQLNQWQLCASGYVHSSGNIQPHSKQLSNRTTVECVILNSSADPHTVAAECCSQAHFMGCPPGFAKQHCSLQSPTRRSKSSTGCRRNSRICNYKPGHFKDCCSSIKCTGCSW